MTSEQLKRQHGALRPGAPLHAVTGDQIERSHTSPPAPPPRPLTPASLLDAVNRLTERDEHLARLVHRYGPPPLWAHPPGFATLVHVVLEQQVSLTSAAALYARLERELDGGVTPESAGRVGAEGLRRLGLTRQKAHYVSALAERSVAGELHLSRLAQLPDEEAASQLMRVLA